MQVTFINVGYGDAILFQASDGYTALLDGGSALPEEFAGNPHRVCGKDFLQAKGIRHLNAVLISHIHEDHVCGLEEIFGQVTVDRMFVPYPIEAFLKGTELKPAPNAARSVPLYAKALNAYRRILLRAQANSIPITVLWAGDELMLHPEMFMHVLAPKKERIFAYMELIRRVYRESGDAVTDCLTELDQTSNHSSLLLRFEGEGAVILSAADSCPSEWDQVPKKMLENVNVLKLPHHGQIDSISELLMRNMPLEYVITTSASDRRYNSANQEVYRRLAALYPPERAPVFLFSDERSYPPYFSRPEGFQAITLVIDSGQITPEFVNIKQEKEIQQ